jgi:hypothetical protein
MSGRARARMMELGCCLAVGPCVPSDVRFAAEVVGVLEHAQALLDA